MTQNNMIIYFRGGKNTENMKTVKSRIGYILLIFITL